MTTKEKLEKKIVMVDLIAHTVAERKEADIKDMEARVVKVWLRNSPEEEWQYNTEVVYKYPKSLIINVITGEKSERGRDIWAQITLTGQVDFEEAKTDAAQIIQHIEETVTEECRRIVWLGEDE